MSPGPEPWSCENNQTLRGKQTLTACFCNSDVWGIEIRRGQTCCCQYSIASISRLFLTALFDNRHIRRLFGLPAAQDVYTKYDSKCSESRRIYVPGSTSSGSRVYRTQDADWALTEHIGESDEEAECRSTFCRPSMFPKLSLAPDPDASQSSTMIACFPCVVRLRFITSNTYNLYTRNRLKHDAPQL